VPIPGKDYPARQGPPEGLPSTKNCEDCGDLRLETDLVTDDSDGAEICSACAAVRVESRLDPGPEKTLLGKSLPKIVQRKP